MKYHKINALYKRWIKGVDPIETLPKSSFGDFVIEGYVGQPLVRLQNAHGDRIVTKIKVVDFVDKTRRR